MIVFMLESSSCEHARVCVPKADVHRPGCSGPAGARSGSVEVPMLLRQHHRGRMICFLRRVDRGSLGGRLGSRCVWRSLVREMPNDIRLAG